LGDANVTDAMLKELPPFEKLTNLDLGVNKKVTDAGLAELAVLTNLTTLNLWGASVTDRGCANSLNSAETDAAPLEKTQVTTLPGYWNFKKHCRVQDRAMIHRECPKSLFSSLTRRRLGSGAWLRQ